MNKIRWPPTARSEEHRAGLRGQLPPRSWSAAPNWNPAASLFSS